MNWFKKVRSILGYFWCEFWEDSWLVQLIVKIYQFIVGESIESRLQQICNQTSIHQSINPQYIYPIKVLIARQPSTNVLDISGFNIGTDNIGQSDSGYLYDVYSPLSPDVLGFRTSVQGEKQDFDFKYYTDSRKLYSATDLQKAGFRPSLQNVNGQPAECLVLWADYKQYSTLRDNFSWVLELPTSWLYKYPGIMSTAWTIKHTGATVELVKQFFSCIGISSQTYLGREGLPSNSTLPGIYVMTDVGYLWADNEGSQSLASDSCLPLKKTAGGTVSSAYIARCREMKQSCDIYVELPSSLNTANYIFQQLWGPSAGIVLLNSVVSDEDMAIATKFIGKNVVKGSILQIYSKESDSLNLLYPNKAEAQTLLSYYNRTTSNSL